MAATPMGLAADERLETLWARRPFYPGALGARWRRRSGDIHLTFGYDSDDAGEL